MLYVYLRGVDDKRTDAASRMIERWNAPERHELKAVIKYIFDEKLDPSTLMRKTKGDTQIPEVVSTRIKVTSTLNFYEEMAISVKDKTVNEQKVFDFFSDMLDQTYLKLASFIENERSIDNAPRYYCEMEALVRRWREKR